MNTLRSEILAALAESADSRGAQVVATMTDDTLLLESGLDSLGFAILVARLEETLGYDPFVRMTEPVYPRTLGEFVDIYERYAPK
ncbi:acyl carrier protein [Roseateles sp. NT4]|uniref:acyl carrier protein n=1 Tax=Roseateles sp. NT4 TaxID=3453715 RepID=UPI003EEE934A